MNTTNFKLIAVGIFIGIIIVVSALWNNIFTSEKYVTVSLSNGTLMFGKISRFPNFTIIDPFIAVKDQNGGEQLVPLSIVPWAPKNGKIRLNDDMIVHWSYLDSASQLVQQMKAPLPTGTGQPSQSVQPSTPQQSGPRTQSTPQIPSQPK